MATEKVEQAVGMTEERIAKLRNLVDNGLGCTTYLEPSLSNEILDALEAVQARLKSWQFSAKVSSDEVLRLRARVKELELTVADYEEELERHSTDRVNQRKRIADLEDAGRPFAEGVRACNAFTSYDQPVDLSLITETGPYHMIRIKYGDVKVLAALITPKGEPNA